jgi:plasmid stability protein
MVCQMKTTLNIDDQVMTRLKAEAARQGRTMSEMVETALRRSLEPDRLRTPLRPLPTFRGGREMVDVSNRDALYRLMEED